MQQTYIVYILQSERSEKRYIGYTQDLRERTKRHNMGRERATKLGVPWTVIHTETYNNSADASRREKELKSYKGGNALKKLLISKVIGE